MALRKVSPSAVFSPAGASGRDASSRSFNESASKILGWPVLDALGRPCADVLGPSATDLLITLNSGNGLQNREATYSSPDGNKIPIRFNTECLYNSDGEISGAVVYLSSDEASYITGHNLIVDGGWVSW